MNLILKLRIPVEKDSPAQYIEAASIALGLGAENIAVVKLLEKALNITDQKQFYYDIVLVASVPAGFANTENLPIHVENVKSVSQTKYSGDRPLIVGFGPAGMFAALEFIEHGIQPLVFERGRKIEERSLDVQRFIEKRTLDTESNIQFGEGGAGSFSDGKLFSRMNNAGYVKKVLDTFIKFGAPQEIAFAAKPHLGTDVLCGVVRNIRNYIIEHGGEIFYSAKMTDLLISDGKAVGLVINGQKEYRASHIYLAVGHSARDTFELLEKKGITLEQKPISIGVRIEHPVEIINLMRYGEKYKDFQHIGAAVYSVNYADRILGRAVHTFCMCPGGEVVNASSSNGLLAINGMSYSKRNSAFSNSAIVATCRAQDYGSASPLAGIEFQKSIEQKAFAAGGGNWKVPAQNLTDFLRGECSSSLIENSCKTGTAAANLRMIFPEFICNLLTDAFAKWKKEEFPLFVSEHALLMGPETRTSCPVRITRGDNFESVNMKNLYPIGEGAGYAGGITSSAADAIKSVESILLS